MSVATHSPLVGSKRLFEVSSSSPDCRNRDDSWAVAAAAAATAAGVAHSSKRIRRSSFSSVASVNRCGLGLSDLSALQQLAELFPGMDQKTIASVLNESEDIDAAIKRLGELQLLEGEGGAQAGKQVEEPAGSGSTPAAGTGESEALRTADEWVELVVSEMAAASDMSDARARAAHVLQQFERQIQGQQKQSLSKELATLNAHVAELTRGNTILKKAVQIQNARLQEVADKDDQLAALQQTLGQYQERIRSLEISNYSLSLHLRQAGSNPMPQHRHPDVF